MKNTIIILIVLMLFGSFVYAKDADNKLYFTDKDDRLYYDTKLFDSDVFMHHVDMIPGNSYTDKLLIENGSDTNYKLYFKVKEVDQSDKANEILDAILMEIYIDGKLIYEGKAKGLDYNNTGVNLQNAIYVGEYNKNVEKELVVKTKLSEEYSDKSNDELSHIEWQFYAQYGDDLIVINPDTGGNNIFKYIMIAIFSGIIIIILLYFYKKKVNKTI